MEERPVITLEDLARVLSETESIESGEEWLDRENVDHEAIGSIIAGAMDAFVRGIVEGKPIQQQFGECIANAFLTGWDCGRELGRAGASMDGFDITPMEDEAEDNA